MVNHGEGGKVVVKDKDGNVLFEGLLVSWTINVTRFGPARCTVEALQFWQIPDCHIAEGTGGATVGACAHQWMVYQGLSETYDYCNLCGVKK